MAQDTRLEEQIAHLNRVVDDLSDVIARQDKEIATLRTQVAKLTARAAEEDQTGGGGVILGDESPPHY